MNGIDIVMMSLKQSIGKYANFPLRTKEENDPRLLVVAVDVKEGEQVTFDSHLSRVDFGYNEEGKTTASYRIQTWANGRTHNG